MRAKRLKTKGIYFLYRVLQAFGLPALLLYFLFRGLRNRAYWRSLPERFGFLPHSFRQTGPGSIWLHAVSVGEAMACLEFARRLRREFPQSPLFVSTSTLAGRATADDKLRGIATGVFFAPVDWVFAVRRVLRTLKPSAVVIAETEIWPNWYREVKRTGAGLMLVNGRISDQAMPSYRRWRWLFPPILSAVDRILAQTEEIRARFITLGAMPDRVEVTGNFKYDFDPRRAGEQSPVVQMLERVRPAHVWIAASTMPPAEPGDPDEDDAVIAAFAALVQKRPRVFLILAPRKPERFDTVASKLEATGLAFTRRTTMGADDTPRVLLLDTIGELSSLFAVADVVFMGGSLARRGGHNILEPAFFAKPVIVGPHMENFQAIADEFRAHGAIVEIGAAGELAAAVERVLADPAEIGVRAKARVDANRGATERAVREIHELMRVPRYSPAMPWLGLAWVLARLWRWGARRRQARQVAERRDLHVPVISVGNLVMGGTGKTPCVLRLAELFRDRGHRPGILTRGYGRNSPVDHMALEPGANVRAEETGDEPQILLHSRVAPVGIGVDRYEAGLMLREKFGCDVMVLDDGFQHVKLARNLDLVLIDALNPFGGGEVFPMGRLREPVEGVARADAILITRCEASDLAPVIEREIRRWNPRAPIFRASIAPEVWVEQRTGKRAKSLGVKRVGMFCGLGNPRSFLRTLESLGLEVVDRAEYDDHHRYRPREMRHLAASFQERGAEAVVTTEKDSVNLCAEADDLLAPLPLYWLKVGMRIAGEDELLSLLQPALRRA
jgi:tetraacyldisaccharide 4'-kinase